MILLLLLLLTSTTADRDHFISHGGPIQGRSSADHHLRAHHSSRITGSSHADAGAPFAKEGATPHAGEDMIPECSPTEEPTLRARIEALRFPAAPKVSAHRSACMLLIHL